jgi:hypothetical protein
MPQTQIACPRCRQPIAANVEQLFDVTSDPQAKQRLLGGVSNHARCPFCGYEGALATPIVYHDSDKELLLTYFPAELGLPVNEQEKMIGPMITQVTNKLPPEKRKGYLLRPQSFLTFQRMIERILGADGITPDMLNEQQKRVNLIQRLMQITTPEVRAEVIQQEQASLDEMFFALFSRLMESAKASAQQPVIQQMSVLQKELMEQTEFGRQLQSQMIEIEAAVKSLQEAGQQLTREKLLEIFTAAPTEARIKALVSLVRNGLDYEFFQILTGRLEQASGEEKSKLEALRENILEFTNEIDKAMEAQMKQADRMIENLLAASNTQEATAQNIDKFNDLTVQVLESKLQEANRKQDTARLQKLQQIVAVLQQASAPPELEFIQSLLDVPADQLEQALAANAEAITPELSSTLASLMTQVESQPDAPDKKEILEKLELIYREVLKLGMQKSMKQ